MLIELEDREGWRVPVVGGPKSIAVGDLVYTCHEQTIDRALAKFAIPGLNRETLDDVLTYCAEQQCRQADASCPGCNRRTQVLGYDSLEEFVAAHKAVSIGKGQVVMQGSGTTTLNVDSFARLQKVWSGETYWYWARRILRKLRHGIRRSEMDAGPFGDQGASPIILLKDAQLADNIGMVARAMGNFGLDELRLVSPRDGWPNEKARIAASGANFIIDHATSSGKLETAVEDLHWLVATTARQRDLRKPILSPGQAIMELRRRIERGERCGILFGGESSGLENSDVALADAVVMIPVNPQFASLNLAQAVLLLGYEWIKEQKGATLGRVTQNETELDSGLYLGHDRPATKAQLSQLFEHLERELDRGGFFNPPEKRPKLVTSLRTMLTRMAATDHEVRTLRGIVATLVRSKAMRSKGDA